MLFEFVECLIFELLRKDLSKCGQLLFCEDVCLWILSVDEWSDGFCVDLVSIKFEPRDRQGDIFSDISTVSDDFSFEVVEICHEHDR